MKTFIIAEAGVNHNGSIELALRMVEEAKIAGVDAIKFQNFKAKNLVSKDAMLADYQKRLDLESQYNLLKPLELSKSNMKRIKDYCDKMSIKFMSSPFGIDSLKDLLELDVDVIKIPSGEITNLPLLREIGKTGLDIILSTGMSNIEEIRTALRILRLYGSDKVTLLHCNSEYPTPMVDVNLRAMDLIRNTFNTSVGYSDHTLGIEVPIAAVAMGAVVIEKHFTMDKTLSGPDHKASLNPVELKNMVNAIRNIEKAKGRCIKEVTPSEEKNKNIVRKSIVAKRNINKGETFSSKNITTKRPGSGISPMKWDEVIGRTASRDFVLDEMIEI